ncbi:hypothetical protein OI450_06120 [Pectobacterium cacticida]|uniref:Uncharacterized protein n=1 Tax=Pectobacterium cacticida TaxID=69221 RepID=A0ABZ2G7B8_9GAMM|nr:hypothetical protein [Pectobacterium cacticida]UYX07946.1 hypothetical protein OI450_06120 [Pectobacterium cacticida]
MTLNNRVMQCLNRGNLFELRFPLVTHLKPFAQPEQTEHQLPVFRLFGFSPKSMAQVIKNIIGISRINVGLMLLVCVHSFLLLLWMNMESLACASDRGRETHRSENVHPVKGSISLATISPTPFSDIYRTLLNTLFLHDFNVVLACDSIGEGK